MTEMENNLLSAKIKVEDEAGSVFDDKSLRQWSTEEVKMDGVDDGKVGL